MTVDTHTNTSTIADSPDAISPTTECSQETGRPYTPRPRTSRTLQSSRSTKYPAELSAHSSHSREAHQHRYEGFEELLREAGYKETRIFTPERERVSSKTETAGQNENKRAVRGGERAETTKLRSVVGFLAGFLASGHAEQPAEHDERGTSTTGSGNRGSNNAVHPQTTTTPSSPSLSTTSPSRSMPPSSPSLPSPGTPQPVRGDIYMHTPTPSNHPRNNPVYLQTNASYTSIASTSTATQPKYLRSAHMQDRRRQSGAVTTSNNLPASHHPMSRPGSSTGRQRQPSDMFPPPVPPLPPQYRDQPHQPPLSRPATPSRYHSTRPSSRAQSRPTTPSAYPRIGQMHSTPTPRDSHADFAPRLRPAHTEPLPASHEQIAHPTPSKAHAYLKHMASMQRILEAPSNKSTSLGDSVDSLERPDMREGEGEDTPRPRISRPRSTPGGPLKGLSLWASFTSSSSIHSHSSGSSGFASQSTAATSPPNSSGMSKSIILSPENDDGSEPDEEVGGYFNLIRSRSQSRSRAGSGRPRIHVDDDHDQTPGARWWRLRQTRSMVQVKVQEEDEHPVGVRRRKSYIGASHPTSKPMVDSTNLAVPNPSRPASASPFPTLPYLVTRLSSPAPPETSEHNRGRTQAKKTRVYCRSKSVPRQGPSGRARRWGLGGNIPTNQEPVPILMANVSSDTESVNEEDDPRERYFSGWGLESDASTSSLLSPPGIDAESLATPMSGVSVPSPPPRQNSIRSLRQHLKLDEQQVGDTGDVPPAAVLATGRDQARARGALPGGWQS